MKIGHLVNALLIHSEIVADYVDESGIRGFIQKLFNALSGAELDISRIRAVRDKKNLWRLKVS